MDKKETIKWLADGSVIYYFYLSGGIAISNPTITGRGSDQWINYSIFSELEKDGTISQVGKGRDTEILREKYQSYRMVN